MKYILSIYGSHKHQDEFVDKICKELLNYSTKDVKYYYGSESAVITLESNIKMEVISDKINEFTKNLPLVYILLPYETDNMSYKMTEEAAETLFGPTVVNEPQTEENVIENEDKFVDLLKHFFGSEIDFTNIKIEFADDTKTKMDLDSILDKINDEGISSLTEKEIQFLNKYSN